MHNTLFINGEDTNYHEGEGYPPDFKVEENIDDILNGNDTVLEFALTKF